MTIVVDSSVKHQASKQIENNVDPDHLAIQKPPGPVVIKLFSCSTELSMKYNCS